MVTSDRQRRYSDLFQLNKLRDGALSRDSGAEVCLSGLIRRWRLLVSTTSSDDDDGTQTSAMIAVSKSI